MSDLIPAEAFEPWPAHSDDFSEIGIEWGCGENELWFDVEKVADDTFVVLFVKTADKMTLPNLRLHLFIPKGYRGVAGVPRNRLIVFFHQLKVKFLTAHNRQNYPELAA